MKLLLKSVVVCGAFFVPTIVLRVALYLWGITEVPPEGQIFFVFTAFCSGVAFSLLAAAEWRA